MGVYRRGRLWWISYAGPDGKLVRESTEQGDQRVAAHMEAERRREVARGTWKSARDRVAEKITVDEYSPRWLARLEKRKVRTVREYRYRYTTHVKPVLGAMALADVRPRHVIDLIERLKAAGEMAPRSIHHVYDVVRSLCREAVIEEVIIASPCVLSPRTLPEKHDADPTWRALALFTRAEVEQLISDERIPEDRRTLYALLFLAALRKGEALGRRWRDLDLDAQPLGRLTVATQYENAPLKTERPREMPVHPLLAELLTAWRTRGWPMTYGRTPRGEDFIVPHRDSPTKHRDPDSTWQRLQDDLDRLELRRRRVHDTRRTFVSLARTDGARPDLLRVVTHGSKGSVFDEYTSFTWEALCAEVAKLNVVLKRPAKMGLVHNQVHSGPAESSVGTVKAARSAHAGGGGRSRRGPGKSR